MAPPSYTHRPITTAIRTLGATRVLTALLDELLKLQTESTNTNASAPDIALDIAATLISAPLAESYTVDQSTHHPPSASSKEPTPRYAPLTLRDALNLLHENIPKLSEKDPLRAELAVRLYRRVNNLLAPPTQVHHHHHHHDPNLDMNMGVNMNMNNIIDNMNLDVGDVNVDTDNPSQNMNMDTNINDQGQLQGQGQGQNVTDPEHANLNQIMGNAAAAVGMDMDMNNMNSMNVNVNMGRGGDGMEGLGLGVGEGDQSIDDVLNAAEMNPEFLDLDMEGMF